MTEGMVSHRVVVQGVQGYQEYRGFRVYQVRQLLLDVQEYRSRLAGPKFNNKTVRVDSVFHKLKEI